MKPSDFADVAELSRKNPILYQGLWFRGYYAFLRAQGKESIPFQRDAYFESVARSICMSGYAAAQALLAKTTTRKKHTDE